MQRFAANGASLTVDLKRPWRVSTKRRNCPHPPGVALDHRLPWTNEMPSTWEWIKLPMKYHRGWTSINPNYFDVNKTSQNAAPKVLTHSSVGWIQCETEAGKTQNCNQSKWGYLSHWKTLGKVCMENGITNKNDDFPQKDKGSEKKKKKQTNNGCAIKISNPSWDHGELTLTNANLMQTQWPTWCAPNSGCPKSSKSEKPCFGKPQPFAQPSTAAMWPIFETKKWSVGWVWNACVPLKNHNFPYYHIL